MMASATIPENKVWTYEDYQQLPDDRQYQIFEGELFMAPAPYSHHQEIALKLVLILCQVVKRLGNGKVFFAPFDVILDNSNVVQPDILFVAKENTQNIRKRGLFGRPDLAIEIVSPSTVQADRQTKMALYERFGVPEYWVVDPGNQTVEVFVIIDGHYQPFAFAAETGKVKSKLLPDFEVDVADVMAQS